MEPVVIHQLRYDHPQRDGLHSVPLLRVHQVVARAQPSDAFMKGWCWSVGIHRPLPEERQPGNKVRRHRFPVGGVLIQRPGHCMPIFGIAGLYFHVNPTFSFSATNRADSIPKRPPGGAPVHTTVLSKSRMISAE